MMPVAQLAMKLYREHKSYDGTPLVMLPKEIIKHWRDAARDAIADATVAAIQRADLVDDRKEYGIDALSRMYSIDPPTAKRVQLKLRSM